MPRFLTVALLCAVTSLTVAGVASVPAQEPTPMPPTLTPAITEIDSDWVGERLRLRAEVVPRGAKVDRVRFRYRGKRFKAKHRGGWRYSRMVKPGGKDEPGDEIRFKVTACTISDCTSRTGGEEGRD